MGRFDDTQELLRRAFLAGYDAGRRDEREQIERDTKLPNNVVPLRGRDATNRRESNA